MGRLIIVDAVTRFTGVAKAVEHFNPVVAYERPEMRFISYPPPETAKRAQKAIRRQCLIDDDEREFRDQMIDWAEEESRSIEGHQLWGLYGVEYELRDHVIDPMEAQVAWHADTDHPRRHIDSHSVLLRDDQRHDRFWDRRQEIEEWIAINAQRDVIGQPTSNGWRFVFLIYSDHAAFRDWIAQPKKTKITLKLRGMREEKIREWIAENVKGQWYEVNPPNERRMMQMRDSITLMFRDTTEAAMCKMRWSDPNEGVEPDED